MYQIRVILSCDFFVEPSCSEPIPGTSLTATLSHSTPRADIHYIYIQYRHLFKTDYPGDI